MNKKFLIILIIVILSCTIIGTGAGLICAHLNNKENSSSKEIELDNGKKVNIVLNETTKIEYEKYDNGLISMEIPKGWKVDVPPVDYIHYSFKLTDPSNPNRMLLFSLKLEGFLKSEKARSTWNYYYPSTGFGNFPVISPKTTEGFYKVWNETAKIVNNQVGAGYYPTISEFNIIENLGAQPVIGGDVLRVNYKNNDKLIQGLVTASVADIGAYYVTENWNVFSNQVDIWPLNVYNIVLLTAPDEEYNEWQPILDHSLGSLEFSQTFINAFNKEEQTIVNTVKTNAKIYDQISDMIMDSWEKRNNSYDIISQKQSDATLGYERVYDTDTGEIYKAYNGFTDDYSENRYQPITDDMYTKPTSGYIEK